MLDEQMIGAIGVSGDLPDKDEECALAGIAAASLQSKI
ncbi:MAG: heme-binding protein [Pseudomonadota bacterium]